jgi:hypothetical protein
MKRSIKERPLTLEEFQRRQHAYIEASAPIIKEMSRIATLSIPKMLLYSDGTLEIKHGNKVRKINTALKEVLNNLYSQLVPKET